MELLDQLELGRCPHCKVHRPQLHKIHEIVTYAHSGGNQRLWRFYKCVSCGGIATAAAKGGSPGDVIECYPQSSRADDAIPARARTYLDEAMESLHAPSGAVMLAASSVDSMLKEKGYKEGVLNARINKAAEDRLITSEMAKWAHEVRLDANDQRHADEAAALPDEAQAKKCIEFARALGEFLFVLPARIERGRKETSDNPVPTA